MVLLAVILMTGPMILGAARLWVELPLLVGVALLLFVQGLRLNAKSASGLAPRMDAIDVSVVLFVVYTVSLWLTSPAEYFSRIEAMTVVGYAIIFFTCRYGLARRVYGISLLWLLVALGVGETIFGYYLSNHLNWFPFGTTERLQLHYAPRWLGTYGCPNHYVSLLVMATMATLALACFSKLAWPVRIVLFYLAGMMLIGVLYSGSRGGWIAFVAAIIALVIFGLRNGTVRWWVPVTGSVLLFAAGGVALSLSPDAQARFAEGADTIRTGTLDRYVRVQLAEDALKIAQDHPAFGTGPGTFVFIHPRYQSSTFGFKAVLTHDDYLNCLDDYGLIGFSLAMFFVAAVTFKFFRPLREDHRWQDRVLVATGFAAWSALLIHSFVDFNLHIPANASLLFALTGLALSRLKSEDGIPHWSSLSLAPLGRGLAWGVLILSVIYGAFVAQTAAGDIAYENAFSHALEIPTSESIDAAKDALAYDPTNVQDLAFLGDLYRYKASRQQDMESRIDLGQKALDAYRLALRGNSLDDTIQARMGMTFDVMKRYSEAYFCYKAAATAQPYNGQFWYQLGNHFWQRGMLDKAEQAYLMASQCPHGKEGSDAAIKELRALPEMQDIPVPASGTNPVQPKPEVEEPATTP